MSVAAAFAEFDVDDDGKLSALEFKALLQRECGLASLSTADVDELLRIFDKSGDGEIDVKEFCEALPKWDTENLFSRARALNVTCVTCKAEMLGFKVQDGLAWNDIRGNLQPASMFEGMDESKLRIGKPYEQKMMGAAGIYVGTVATVHCSSCDHQLGWKHVHSPVASSPVTTHTEQIGLMLPQVALAEQPEENESFSLPPPADSLDSAARCFMMKERLVGLSAAWALPGTLLPASHPEHRELVARSWGWSALNERGGAIPMTTATQLRVASSSKPLTAVGVLKLMEAGKLDLDDAVLPLLGLAKCELRDARAKAITVRHLLHHVGGGWTNKKGGVMFQHARLSLADLIEKTLRERALDHEPGTQFAYSNFGYCMLGRVIERLSGMSYESYICKEVLGPCGIEVGIDAAGPYVEDGRCSATTHYFTEKKAASKDDRHVVVQDYRIGAAASGYPMNDVVVGRYGPSGGWVIAPSELVRFSQALDQPGVLLSELSLKMMIEPHAASGTYAMGWFTNAHARWHGGGMAGTGAILVATKARLYSAPHTISQVHYALVTNGAFWCPALQSFGIECLKERDVDPH